MKVSESLNAVELIPRIRIGSEPSNARHRSEVVRPSGKISRMELQFRQPDAHVVEFSPKIDAGSRKMVHYKRANRLNYILCGVAFVVMAGLALVMRENGKQYVIATDQGNNSISQRHIVLVDDQSQNAQSAPKNMREHEVGRQSTLIDQTVPLKKMESHKSSASESVPLLDPRTWTAPVKVGNVDVDLRTRDLMGVHFVASGNR